MLTNRPENQETCPKKHKTDITEKLSWITTHFELQTTATTFNVIQAERETIWAKPIYTFLC